MGKIKPNSSIYKFHFQPFDGYLGDCMPFYWDNQYHIFYLKASLENAGVENVIWSHIRSEDLLHWEELPDVLLPDDNEDAPDKDGCWSGSVISHQGIFHIFYTGVRGFGTECFQQSICMAQSDDLIHFHKNSKNPILSIERQWYSGIAWADPFVFWNEQEKTFWMLINSQAKGGIRSRSGCIGLAKSTNLEQWQIHKPFYTPNTVPYPEVPELFRYKSKWYLLYSETTDFCCTHYRLSDRIDGPWKMPTKLDSFDTSELYAIKTLFDGHYCYGLGWVRRKQGNKDEGATLWGGALGIARKLTPRNDGSLKVYYPDSLKKLGRGKSPLAPKSIYGKLESSENNFKIKTTTGMALAMCQANQWHFYFKCNIIAGKAASNFGFILRANEDLSNAYKIKFEKSSGKVVAQRLGSVAGGVFNSPVELTQRPLSFSREGQLKFEIFVDADIAEVFVNKEFAISFRAYERGGMGFVFFVEEGQVEFKSCEFYLI